MHSIDRGPGIWLLACAALLLALILVGGATRLTGSGLSMVHWKPLTVIPPLDKQAWQNEFDAYRQSPEYQIVNRGMSVEEFKTIYWFEFGHRLLARGLGLAFAIPLLWFWWRGRLPGALRWSLFGVLLLGAAQGYMGWYMVKSGLVDIPRVSPYRLAAHLSLALLIFSLLLRLGIGLLWPRPRAKPAPVIRKGLQTALALTALTILWGAFVAGHKAGLLYNTFPLMAGRLVPEGLLGLEPMWRNLFENPTTVQFLHRWLALTTLTWIIGLLALSRKHARKQVLTAVPARLIGLVAGLATTQVALGISTLLLYVPVALGVLHQAVAVMLLGAVVTATWASGRDWSTVSASPNHRRTQSARAAPDGSP